MRQLLAKYRELIRFALVGGASFVVTLAITYALKFTVLSTHPVTALIIGSLIATIFSYVANREWAFHTRGGRERTHEAALFFLISGIALGLNALPQWLSRYALHLQVPRVSLFGQEAADFVSGMIIGTLLGTLFRWWAFRKWVFPAKGAPISAAEETPISAGEAPESPDLPGEKAA